MQVHSLRCLQKFCRKTTLRVLPRCAEAKSTSAIMFWLIIFSGLLIALLFCGWLLTNQYLKFHTHYEVSKINLPFPYPAITVCPNQPIGLVGLRQHSPRRWYKEIIEANHLNNTNNQHYLNNIDFQQYYQSFQNVSLGQAVGKTYPEVVLMCRYSNSSRLGRTQETSRYYNCVGNNSPLIIGRTIIPEYFNCYTVQWKNRANDIQLTEMHLIINTFINSTVEYDEARAKEALEGGCDQCMLRSIHTWNIGARIILHIPDTRPDLDSDLSLQVIPGKHLDVTISAHKYRHMKPPWGQCEDSHSLPKVKDKGKTYQYSQPSCQANRMQKELSLKCKCVNPSLPLQNEANAHEYPYCEETSSSQKIFNATRLRCMGDVMFEMNNQSHNQYDPDCPVPCDSSQYFVLTSSINDVVDVRSMFALYLDFLMEMSRKRNTTFYKPYSEEIAHFFEQINHTPYKTAFDLYNQSKFVDALQYLTNHSNEIKAQSAIFSLRRYQHGYILACQTPLFTLPSLLSMLGGLGSLFVGFNLFVGVELIELVYKLIVRPKTTSNRMEAAQETTEQHRDGRHASFHMRRERSKRDNNSATSQPLMTNDVLVTNY